MISPAALLTVLQEVPGFWGFALAALGLILSTVSVVWVSIHRTRILLHRAETERATRMLELETAKEKMRLDAQLRRDMMLADGGQPERLFSFGRNRGHDQLPV